jgi:hypothetical protein
MTTWAEFAAAAPEMAELGHRLLYRTEIGQGLLATVKGNALPRIHPVYVAVMDGRLLTFINPSIKARDLVEDGRYALHNHQDATEPHEFVARGRARLIADPTEREPIAEAWYFSTGDGYLLFELLIDNVILGKRATADDWPPAYQSWRAGRGGAPST